MKQITSKILIVLTVFTVMGFGVYAFADEEMSYGRYHGGWGHHGHRWHHGGYGCPGYGYMTGDLSDEEIQKMNEQRKVFFKSTEDLRQNLYQKRLALEMASSAVKALARPPPITRQNPRTQANNPTR